MSRSRTARRAGIVASSILAANMVIGGCATTASTPEFVRVQTATDRDTYSLRRIGVLPFAGDGLEPGNARSLAQAFAGALSREASMQVRVLDARDLAEVPPSDTFRRGWTRPETMLALGRRFELDAVLVGDVRRAQWFTPQRLELSVDLVSTETGMPIWSASIELDAGSENVRRAMKRWYERERGGDGSRGPSWEMYLLSPQLFCEFAAEQVARRW